MKEKILRFIIRWACKHLERSKVMPDGIPGIRDIENPCDSYFPQKLPVGYRAECQGDGHFLCDECCYLTP